MADRIPLYDRRGEVVAWATVDGEDSARIGAHRWFRHATGYAARGFRQDGKYRLVYMHREVLAAQPGESRQVDHINRDRLDNRRANLRFLTLVEQRQNQSSHRGATSRYRGVRRLRSKWQVRVHIDGHTHYGGVYVDEDEAGRVAARLRRELMPYSAA